MIAELKKKLFFLKYRVLFTKACNEGDITLFDEEIFKKMEDTIIACLPVSIYIKYSNLLFPDGTCYDRSLYMFLALEDALLVRGKNMDLVYNFGEGHGGHGWIEIGDYVYDPSTMLKYRKDVYYKLFECADVFKIDKESYIKDHKEFYDAHVTTDFDEFRPGGKRRLELGVLMIQHRKLAELSGNEDFKKDLTAYLEDIEYDENQIQRERNKIIDELLYTKGALDVMSASDIVEGKKVL